MKIAYADPPYYKKGYLYPEHPSSRDWDNLDRHDDLIRQLTKEYDLWALSINHDQWKKMFLLLPSSARVGIFYKSPQGHNSFELVIFNDISNRSDPDWLDVFVDRTPNRRGLVGSKPLSFYYWIFRGLGLTADDEFTDLFPGTNTGMRAYMNYIKQYKQFNLEWESF